VSILFLTAFTAVLLGFGKLTTSPLAISVFTVLAVTAFIAFLLRPHILFSIQLLVSSFKVVVEIADILPGKQTSLQTLKYSGSFSFPPCKRS
jgi:hypothetical protein